MHSISKALLAVRERIAQAERKHERAAGSVRLLAVCKKKPAAAVREAYEAGQRAFGENHLQDALPKVEALRELGLEWHFIGPVQSNKTRPISAHFDWVHSVDRLKTARRLSEQREPALGELNVCIQLNLSGEDTKSGVETVKLEELASQIAQLPRLKLRGLMVIPRPETDFESQRVPFRRLREALESLNVRGFGLDTLSMGMTGDMEAAIAEGATIVRIGTAIFGPRDA